MHVCSFALSLNMQNLLTFPDLLQNFEDLDRNGDGILSSHEFSRFFDKDDGKMFSLLDADHDEGLTKQELSTTMDQLQKYEEENGGVDQNWLESPQKNGSTDADNNIEDGDSTSKNDTFNWLDYV